jgi:hypothetical protein
MTDYYSPRVSPDDGLLFPEGITLMTDYYLLRVSSDNELIFPEGITG